MKTTFSWSPLLSVATIASVLGGLTGTLVLTLPRPAQAEEAEAIAKIKDLNKKAVDAYENLELEEARKFLMQALEISAAEGLNRHAVKATTHLNLGVVLVGGLKQRDTGIKQFRRALEIDPNLKVPKRLSNPEIQSAFDAATKGGGEPGDGRTPVKPPPVAATPPATPPAAANTALTVVHEPIADATAGRCAELAREGAGGRPLREAGAGLPARSPPPTSLPGTWIAKVTSTTSRAFPRWPRGARRSRTTSRRAVGAGRRWPAMVHPMPRTSSRCPPRARRSPTSPPANRPMKVHRKDDASARASSGCRWAWAWAAAGPRESPR